MGTENDGGNAGGTFTQADVDRIVRERLAREREKYADYDELKSKAGEADKNKSALDKLLEKVSGLEERASKAEAAALRADVAQAKGLTPAQAKRLHGSTREELEADADELLSMFKPAEGKGGDGGKDGDGKGTGDGDGGKGGVDTSTTGGDAGGKGALGDGKGGDGEGRRALPAAGGRPKEKLTSGAVPGTSGEKSPAEMAESILSGF
ncbi:DUF4355 domain-containing protein [Micromonospora sp. NPDC047465]|uniref:capsid assembly scaffolding protein Gp46 family protein n=1 Tax=Micromonospora sp. NPDC047465 TaxID=3154813 RepID=UPI0033F61930